MTTVSQIETLNQSVKAIYLTAEDLKLAASVLYLAYHDDPLFMDIFDVEWEGYEARLRNAIREELNAFRTAGQPMIGLFEDARLLACACITSPNKAFDHKRFWHWRLKMLLSAGRVGMQQMIEKEQKIRAHMPAENFHVLSFIGVHPEHQHRGLGHLLMSAIDGLVSEDSQSQGIGVYVTLAKNMGFFEDGEYQMIEQLQVGQIYGHIMFREKT